MKIRWSCFSCGSYNRGHSKTECEARQKIERKRLLKWLESCPFTVSKENEIKIYKLLEV